jgi:hypothetical protein
MNKNLMASGLFAWALLGAPIAFFVFIDWSYRRALEHGRLPFLGSAEWIWYVAFGICLATGAISLIKLPILRDKNPYVVGITYAIIMGAALVAIHLRLACGHGDCI